MKQVHWRCMPCNAATIQVRHSVFELYENERAYRKHLNAAPYKAFAARAPDIIDTEEENYPGATVSGRQTHHTE